MKTKLNRRFLRAVPGSMALLLVNLFLCHAQVDSRYNLRSAKVGLMDGRVIENEITGFEPDSLAVRDRTTAPPGSQIKLTYAGRLVRALVIDVTPDYLIVSLSEQQGSFRIPRNRVRNLRIVSSPLSRQATEAFQQRWYPASSIKYIATHKKGSGGTGAVVGLIAGAAIGYGLAKSQEQEPAPGQFTIKIIDAGAAGGVLGGIIGAPWGAAVGTINNRIMIEGDLTRFQHARKRIVR